MWTKVKPNRGNPNLKPNNKRVTFAVMRNRSHAKPAFLIIPEGMAPGPRASVYHDGDRLAFAFGQRGDYKVGAAGAGKAFKVTIPSQFADRIPYGTTDVTPTRDGDMLVLDLSAIGQAQSSIGWFEHRAAPSHFAAE